MTVFESVPTIRPLGVGLNLLPHAVRELTILGLDEKLAAISIPTAELSYHNKFGQLIWREPRGLNAGYRWPQYSMHRGRLQMLLLEAAQERLGKDRIRTGLHLDSFAQDNEGVTARFIDRATGQPAGEARGDVLIDAEGIHSAVRRAFYPQEGTPPFSGRMLWRAVTEAGPFLTGRSMIMAGHADQKSVAYPICPDAAARGRSLINWVAELRVGGDEAPIPRDWNRRADKEQFAPAFKDWRFDWLDVPALIEGAETVYEFPMVDRDPVPRWSHGRVTLLGDAAHPMYPVASTCRFVGAFGAAFLISLFVRPLVKYLGAESEIRGFQLTMAIVAVVSVVLILITFATTKERVTPPPQQKTNVREELGELFKNWPWVVLLITSIFSNAFSALRSGSTIFFFKYVQGYDSSPVLWGLDRTTLFLTSGALGLVLGTVCLGPIARKIDKKYYAAALSLVTGVCFLSFFFVPKGQFGLMIAVNMLAQFCAGPTSALTWALYADVADYGEVKYRRRSTGLIYSASLFSIKSGILIGGFLVPLFLAKFGYVKGAATQTANALLGIALAFSIGPAFFALLKAGALMIYPLNQKRVDEIERELAARRAAAAAETKLA